jgi:hypothetical protein
VPPVALVTRIVAQWANQAGTKKNSPSAETLEPRAGKTKAPAIIGRGYVAMRAELGVQAAVDGAEHLADFATQQ